jgi:hypothetical protein
LSNEFFNYYAREGRKKEVEFVREHSRRWSHICLDLVVLNNLIKEMYL